MRQAGKAFPVSKTLGSLGVRLLPEAKTMRSVDTGR